MTKISFIIDDMNIIANEGTTILQAALKNGIYIPHLCYHPECEPNGSCRLCMVEITNGELVTSCRTPIELGMTVKTKSAKVDKAVRPIVELLIADHHATCAGCPAIRRCELQRIMAHLRIDRRRVRRLRLPEKELPLHTLNPLFDYDPNRCIRCGICVQICERTHEVSSLYFLDRGYATRIAFFGDSSKCQSCGQCIAGCPVGALISKATVQ